jgi:hypothetical protein
MFWDNDLHYLTKKEIKSLKSKEGFVVKMDVLLGEWFLELNYDGKLHTVRTKRGEIRTFKKMDAVVNFLKACNVEAFYVIL